MTSRKKEQATLWYCIFLYS